MIPHRAILFQLWLVVSVLRSGRAILWPERADFRPEKDDLRSERGDFWPGKANLRLGRAELSPKSAVLWSGRADLRPERIYSGLGGLIRGWGGLI